LFILLNVVDFNCLRREVCSIDGKPPGYATISNAFIFLKQHAPKKNIYNQALWLNYQIDRPQIRPESVQIRRNTGAAG
jgi:hypothetical protein